MAAVCRPLLHVVYAGRGDAFYLEYTAPDHARKLVMVDSGPRSYAADAPQNEAPYWKYYVAAGKKIWERMATGEAVFRTDAIIATHLHDDHMYGFLNILPRAFAANAMMLTGPLVIPGYRAPQGGLGNTATNLIFNDVVKPLRFLINQPANPQDRVPIPGVEFCWPGRARTVVMTRNPAAPEPDEDQFRAAFQELGDLNSQSILLQVPVPDPPDPHNPAAEYSDGQSGYVFMTGDSNGNRIAQHVKNRQLSIFKIQHHGSRKDAQYSGFRPIQDLPAQPGQPPVPDQNNNDHDLTLPVETNFAIGILRETAVLAIMSHQHTVGTRLPLPDGITDLARIALYSMLIDALTESLGRTALAADFKLLDTNLRERNRKYLESLCVLDRPRVRTLTQLLPFEGNPSGVEDNQGRPLDINDLWNRIVLKVQALPDHGFEGRNLSSLYTKTGANIWVINGWVTGFLVTTAWWDRYWDRLAATLNICRFFLSFRADAYVVSAKWVPHKHPQPATLLGLALALRRQERAANLYMTNADSFNYDEFSQLARNFGSDATVLLRDHLKIRYLARGVFMSLDARYQFADRNLQVVRSNANHELQHQLDASHAEGIHDVYGVTELWQIDDQQATDRDTLTTELETKRSSLMPKISVNWYEMRVERPGQLGQPGQRYLMSVAGAHDPRLTAHNNHPALYVEEPWTYGGGMHGVAMARGQLRIHDSTSTSEMVVKPVKTPVGWHMTWEIPDADPGDMLLEPDVMTFVWNVHPNLLAWSAKIYRTAIADDNEIAVFEMVAGGPPPPPPVQHAARQINTNLIMQDPMLFDLAADDQLVMLQAPAYDYIQSFQISALSIAKMSTIEPVQVFPVIGQDMGSQPIQGTVNKSPLEQYLRDAKLGHVVDRPEGISGLALLKEMISENNLRSLKYDEQYQRDMLSLKVDVAKSWISYINHGADFSISHALISFQVPEAATIAVGPSEIALQSAVFLLTWDAANRMWTNLRLQIHEYDYISAERVVQKAIGVPTLAKVLRGMDIDETKLGELTVPNLLGYLSRDYTTTFARLVNSVPSIFVKRGFTNLMPDFDQSTALVSYLPTGSASFDRVDIICVPPKELAQGVNVGPISFQLKGISLVLENTSCYNERLTLTALAVWQAKAIQNEGTGTSEHGSQTEEVEIAINVNFTRDEPIEMTLRVLKAENIFTLASRLSAPGDMKTLKAPFSKESNLGALPMPASADVTIKLLEPIRGGGQYQLKSISTAITFNDWQDFLPEAVIKHVVMKSARATIYDPLDKEHRRLGGQIVFDLKLDEQNSVDTLVSAEPMPTSGDWEYRVALKAARNQGISLQAIANALGLSNLSSDISSQIPFVAEVLSRVHVKEVAAGLLSTDKGCTIDDWTLRLYIDQMQIKSGVVSIGDVAIDLRKETNTFSGMLRGYMIFEKVGKVATVELSTPTKSVPGTIEVQSPNGISAQDLLTNFSLPDLSNLPVIGTALTTELRSAKLVLVHERPDRSAVQIVGVEAHFRVTKLRSLGGLVLDFIDVSVEHHLAKDPYGRGYDQTSFVIGASLGDDSLQVRVMYDTHSKHLGAMMVPRKTQTIAETFGKVLPTAVSATNLLKDVLGDLHLLELSVVFGLSEEFTIQQFKLHVARRTQLVLQPPAGDGLSLDELKVVYDAAVESKDEGDFSSPTQASSSLASISNDSVTNGTTANGDLTGTSSVPKQSAGQDQIETKSKVEESKVSKLVVQAAISKGGVSVKVQVDCVSAKEKGKAVAFIITPAMEKTLTIKGIFGLFGLVTRDLAIELPQGAPEVFDFVIDEVSGALATRNKSLAFERFTTVGHSVGTLTVLEGLELKNVYTDVTWKRLDGDKANLFGIFCGQLLIGTLLFSLAFVKDEDVKKPSKFYADIRPEQYDAIAKSQKGSVQLAQIFKVGQLPDDSYQLPEGRSQEFTFKSLQAEIVPSQSIQLSFASNGTWKGECSGIRVELHSVQVFVRAETAKKQYTAAFLGTMELNGMVSLEARYYFDTRSGNILTAKLEKKDGAPDNQIELIAEQQASGKVSSDDNGQTKQNGTVIPTNETPVSSSSPETPHWRDLVAAPFTLEKTGILLTADFRNSRYILYVKVQNVGAALFLGKTDPKTKRRDYVFLLEAVRVNQIWSNLEDEVTSQFDIDRLAVQVISYDTTMDDLRKILKIEDNATKEDQKPLDTMLDIVRKMPEKTNIQKGAWFFAQISIKNGGKQMTDAVAFDSQASQDTIITLYARVATEDKKDNFYGIDIRGLQLFGGSVQLDGQGVYRPGAKSQAGELELGADLKLTSEELFKKSLYFKVKLMLRPTETRFDFEGKPDPGQSITNPFEEMFNVYISNLKFSGSSTKSKTDSSKRDRNWTISGEARLGAPDSKHVLNGSIMFVNGKPRVVKLQYEQKSQSLALEKVYSDIVQPNSKSGEAGQWPSDQTDSFALEQVSILYTSKGSEVKIDDVIYMQGYNIKGDFTVFEMPFSVSLELPQDRKGITIRGTYRQSIDLGFAILTKDESKIETKDGPSVFLDTTKDKKLNFGVTAGLTLFDTDGFSFDLRYGPAKEKKDRNFSGKVAYTKGKLLGIDKPEVEFTYKDGSWSFKGWGLKPDTPWSGSEQQKILEDAMKKGSSVDKNQGCGKLVELVIDKLVEFKWDFTLSLPPTKSQQIAKEPEETKKTREFKFNVEVFYNVFVAAQDIGRVTLGTITLVVPLKEKLSVSGVLKILWDTLKDDRNLPQIGAKILENPDVLGKLALALGVKKLATEIIAKFLCRKANSKDLKNEGRARHNEKMDKEIDEKLKEVKKTLEKIKDAVKTAGAGAAAAAGLLEGLADVLAGLGIVLGGLLLAGTLGAIIMAGDDEEAKAELKKRIKEAEEALAEYKRQMEEAKRQLSKAMVLKTGATATYTGALEDSIIRIDWTAAIPDPNMLTTGKEKGLTYDVCASLANARPFAVLKTEVATFCEATDPAYRTATHVFFWVRAKFTNPVFGLVEAEVWTAVVSQHIPWLRAPLGFTFTATDEHCILKLPPSEDTAADYEVCIQSSDKTEVLLKETFSVLDAGASKISIPIRDIKPLTAEFTKPVQALIKRLSWDSALVQDSQWVWSRASLPVKAAPVNLQTSVVGRDIRVQWQYRELLAIGAFQIELYRADDTRILPSQLQIKPQPDDGGNHVVLISQKILSEKDNINVYVRATAERKPTICLAALMSMEILYPLVVTIANGDYDVSRGILTLELAYSKSIAKEPRATVRLDAEPAYTFAAVTPASVSGVRGVLRARMQTGTPPPISVRAVVGVGAQTATSEPWRLPAIPSSPLKLGTTSFSFSSTEGLRVSWVDAVKAEGVTMIVTLGDAAQEFDAVTLTADTSAQDWVLFAPAECPFPLKPGSKVTVFRMVKGKEYTGERRSETYIVPG